MSTLKLSGVNSHFFSTIPLSTLNVPLFFAYFKSEKMRSIHSAQHNVKLRRLGNKFPVLGKANSLCKIVKCCVFCLFVTLRLNAGRLGPRDKDIPGYRNSGGKIHVGSRRCNKLPVAPLAVGKILTPAFYAFSSALSRFFVR